MALNRASILWTASLLTTAAALAQSADVTVNLTEPDTYAHRAVTVMRTDASPLVGVLAITSFDAPVRTFVFETARHGTVRMPAADISELVFTQSLKQSSPMAQACPFTVIAAPGQTSTLEVPGGSLRIARGGLFVSGVERAALSVPGEVLEAKRIAYDRSKDAFTISLQAMKYDIRVSSCGGGGTGPGASKGLQ